MLSRFFCKLGFHDFYEREPDLRFNPDWRYDGCVGSIVTVKQCSRCPRAEFASSSDYYWWDIDYSFPSKTDQEAFEEMELILQKHLESYRKEREK